ncbi:xylose isomerase family protein [Corchorus capsularis]|uniref:Xylose isomerase family protein n=1 Tax=Corchorus capsularis TaxID=210143 RepID=A0A1R3GVS1_COCAP|nr:xylose isomerase family protein [Corchorus capsularis]
MEKRVEAELEVKMHREFAIAENPHPLPLLIKSVASLPFSTVDQGAKEDFGVRVSLPSSEAAVYAYAVAQVKKAMEVGHGKFEYERE